MSGARVILTGATGLIGRATAPALAREGFEVIALSRSGRNVAGAAEALACDLLDPLQVALALKAAAATHLVHLAWADGRDRWTSPQNETWADATLSLLSSFAARGGRRAVVAGSCAEYDWSQPVLSETTPLRPASAYGRAKARAGAEAAALAARVGFGLAWARPFFVYGPGEPEGRLIGDLVRGLGEGREVDCTDGLQRRDYLYSADLGRAFALLLASDVTGPINLASGSAMPVRDLILEVAARIGHPERVHLGARPRPPGDPDELRADVTRARDLLGFRPDYDLPAGVAALLSGERVGA